MKFSKWVQLTGFFSATMLLASGCGKAKLEFEGDIETTKSAIQTITNACLGDLRELNLKINFQACNTLSPISVELRSAVAPYTVVDASPGVGGNGLSKKVLFANAQDGVPYYLVIKHINALETWSATPITFASRSASYDFTTGVDKAFGSRQIMKNGLASLYQGDVNADGFFDASDIVMIENDATLFVTRALTDLTCDNYTDLSDTIPAYNNAVEFVQVARPQ